MILRVPVPDGWVTETSSDGVVHTRGGVTIQALRLREHPDDPRAWMRHTALKGAPAHTTYTQNPTVKLTTAEGWPAVLQESELIAEGFYQHRIVVLYVFLDYAAGAVVRADHASFPGQRAELLDLLGKATPDWGDQRTASLAHLFEGVLIPAIKPPAEG